jgi:hypothetical protein
MSVITTIDKYGNTPAEREKWIQFCMDAYHVTRKEAEAWYENEDAINL